MVMAVFVATVLIANLCHTDPAAALLGACIGTLTYQIITKFKSPMFISSCGATVSAVCGALCSTGAQYIDGQWVGNPNYLMVIMGGLLIIGIYSIFALIIKFKGIQSINKIFPPVVVGGVTMVIGLNLAKFLITYCGQFGAIDASGTILNISVISNPTVITGVLIAIATMIITAVVSHYGKGFMKNIPFLFGIAGGYILTVILQFSIPYFSENPLISFEAFNNLQWYPDVPFAHPEYFVWDWGALGQTVIYFLPVAICALLEHYSDHKTLSNIIGHDLTEDPGLHRTLLGDGVASAVGTIVCGQPNTSYGESIATIGFSKVASVIVTTVAAVILGLLSFFAPLNAFIQTVPQFVFGGCAMILYGFIAASGLKTIMNNKVDLENNKNLVILSVVLTVGVGGIALGLESLKGVSLAMILGVILNLILRDKKVKVPQNSQTPSQPSPDTNQNTQNFESKRPETEKVDK
jgi:uracil permease